jgi:peptidoglycan/LPS O-acetylase OafA/YrhL
LLAFTPALDGIRGIAIILVLFHHLTLYRPTRGLDGWIASVPLIGWSGVDLFFVLSGFLITGILIDARSSERYFSSFYARRTLRIFPLYYLVVFVSLVVLPLVPAWHQVMVGMDAPPPQWPYWSYLTNFAVAERDFRHGILDVAWSLAIEEQFYIVWAAVVWLCPPRWLGALCAALVLGAPLARVGAVAGGAEPVAVYVLTWYRADALATGALLAWLARRGWMPWLASIAPRVAIGALAGLVAVVVIDGDTWWWGPWMQRVGFSLLAITGAAMLVAAVAKPPGSLWPRMLSANWLRAFGKYSYCLYLIHLPVMRLVRTFVLPEDQFAAFGSPWAGQLVFYALATIPAFAVAWLSWRVFEGPILKLKNRFPY